MRRALALYDRFRLDHFRGFAGFWAIPVGAETARDGHWETGPGIDLFRRAETELGPLPVIAEDLGLITADVVALRDELGFPGTVVMLWSQLGPEDNPHRVENHRVEQVVYTSTHDTETLQGAFPHADAWWLVEAAMQSPAALAVIPAQDVLLLGNDARMNRPGEVGGNWAWRLEPEQLGGDHAAPAPSRGGGGPACLTARSRSPASSSSSMRHSERNAPTG